MHAAGVGSPLWSKVCNLILTNTCFVYFVVNVFAQEHTAPSLQQPGAA